MIRDVCSSCESFSLVTLGMAQACINRRCPSNRQDRHLSTCGTDSQIDTGKGQVCVKSSCPTLLQLRNAPRRRAATWATWRP